MLAISNLIFRIAALQKKPGFLVTFLLQIMHQDWVGIAWHLFCQLINPRKEWQQIRFRIDRCQRFHGAIQLHQRVQQILFQ